MQILLTKYYQNKAHRLRLQQPLGVWLMFLGPPKNAMGFYMFSPPTNPYLPPCHQKKIESAFSSLMLKTFLWKSAYPFHLEHAKKKTPWHYQHLPTIPTIPFQASPPDSTLLHSLQSWNHRPWRFHNDWYEATVLPAPELLSQTLAPHQRQTCESGDPTRFTGFLAAAFGCFGSFWVVWIP